MHSHFTDVFKTFYVTTDRGSWDEERERDADQLIENGQIDVKSCSCNCKYQLVLNSLF